MRNIGRNKEKKKKKKKKKQRFLLYAGKKIERLLRLYSEEGTVLNVRREGQGTVF